MRRPTREQVDKAFDVVGRLLWAGVVIVSGYSFLYAIVNRSDEAAAYGVGFMILASGFRPRRPDDTWINRTVRFFSTLGFLVAVCYVLAVLVQPEIWQRHLINSASYLAGGFIARKAADWKRPRRP